MMSRQAENASGSGTVFGGQSQEYDPMVLVQIAP